MRPQPLAALLLVASCSGRASGEHGAQAEIRWQPPVEIASGRGQKGEWRQNESDFDYVDDPSVALDAAGNAAIVWVDQATSDVWFQEYAASGQARRSPVNVSRTPDVFSWLPRIAIAGDDVYVLWQEIVFSGGTHGGEAFFARSRDRGATFEPALNLSRSVNGDGKGQIDDRVWDNGSLDLVVARDGTLLAAWTEFDGALWLSRSTDGGAAFTAPRLVANEPGRPARGPALAAGPDGAAYLAWTVGRDDAADLRIATMPPGADTFGAPAIIARTRGFTDAPKLAVDAGGTLHLVYAESEGGPGTRSHITYARSRDGGRTFETPRVVTRPAGEASAGFPMLALDRRTVLITWERYATPRDRPRGLGITYSRDGGTTFAREATVASSRDPAGGSNGSQQGLLMRKLALDRGRIALVNSALVPGRGSRVWLMRGALDR